MAEAANIFARLVRAIAPRRAEAAAEEPIKLSRRDSQRVAEALLNPPPPSVKLKRAAAAYREALASGRLESR